MTEETALMTGGFNGYEGARWQFLYLYLYLYLHLHLYLYLYLYLYFPSFFPWESHDVMPTPVHHLNIDVCASFLFIFSILQVAKVFISPSSWVCKDWCILITSQLLKSSVNYKQRQLIIWQYSLQKVTNKTCFGFQEGEKVMSSLISAVVHFIKWERCNSAKYLQFHN